MIQPVSLPDKIVAIHEALEGVEHAFGGALSLAYHAEPRSTIDIDLNVFAEAQNAGAVFKKLSVLGIKSSSRQGGSRKGPVDFVIETGQTRVFWGNTPIDLFFSYDPFHEAMRKATLEVPFAETTIRILSATHLCVCKAVFNRPKDWVDIQAVLGFGTHVDTAEALRWLARIVGDEDSRYERLAAMLTS